MANVKIGWAEESIVPGKKIFLDGQFYERVSDIVESEITATAMAISCGSEKAILISVDIAAIFDGLLQRIRREFQRICPDFPAEHLIVGATHTHTSIQYKEMQDSSVNAQILHEFMPDTASYASLVNVEGDDVLHGEEASEFIATRVAQAAKNAWDNRKDALVANGFGRAVVGFCRRVVYDDGSAQMWGDTNTPNFVAMEGGNDSGVELLYVFDTNKKLTGVVANIACPSQILEHHSFISSDYWGKVKENLRRHFGDDLFLLAMGGAGGDQCPRDLIRWVNAENPINDPNIKRPDLIDRIAGPSMFDLPGCRLVGKRIANEIISVFEELPEPKPVDTFYYRRVPMALPLRKTTIQQHEQALRELNYYASKMEGKSEFNFEDTAAMYIYAGTVARFRQQQTQETVSVELHILRLGDIAIATNPFELFLDYGNRIRARSRAKQTFIMQLTGGWAGYLPTQKAEQGGHYSAYISSGFVGHEGGDLMTRNTIDIINCLMANNGTDCL